HFMWGKVTLFEECARVPMIVHVPGRTKPKTSSAGLVELVDLYPTLAELCGLDLPEKLQGRSLTGMLDDPAAAGKESAYTVVSRGELLGRVIRSDHWRYAEWGSREQNELYDLNADPAEHVNLVNIPEHRRVVRRMQRMLSEKQAQAAAAREPIRPK
ncbi:MAG: DUF4976 domain-containing protein, partial [Planctomycetales bacterium]